VIVGIRHNPVKLDLPYFTNRISIDHPEITVSQLGPTLRLGNEPDTRLCDVFLSSKGHYLASPLIRVLIADDSKAFLHFISSKLQARPIFQAIYQVSDGLRAVREAQHLQPDLVLLEIRLPSLNGIDAARRIRKCSPRSKILIVSQLLCADVVQEAFKAGASGYVTKVDLGGDLLPAVRAVLRGENFVGRRFAGHDFAGCPTHMPVSGSNHAQNRTIPIYAKRT